MAKLLQSISSGESDLYKNCCLATGVGSIIGFFVGGRLGARMSSSDYILSNQLTPYQNKMQAHRQYHSAMLDGYVRNGCRWGWRAGIFAGLYSGTMTILAEYRNKHDGLNILVAGATTGAAYKLLHGVRGIIVGTVVGSLCSLPVAAISHAILWMTPEEFKEKINRLNKEEKEKRNRKPVEPWKKNLEVTEQMVTKMQQDLDDTTCGKDTNS